MLFGIIWDVIVCKEHILTCVLTLLFGDACNPTLFFSKWISPFLLQEHIFDYLICVLAFLGAFNAFLAECGRRKHYIMCFYTSFWPYKESYFTRCILMSCKGPFATGHSPGISLCNRMFLWSQVFDVWWKLIPKLSTVAVLFFSISCWLTQNFHPHLPAL